MPALTSVQLYSIRDAIDADLDHALERIAGLGLTAVEPYGFVERAAEFQRALTAAGLTAPSAHAPVIDAADPARVFAAAAELGVTTVIDPFIPAERWQSADDAARLAERVNTLSVDAATAGVRFGYHNHHWELLTRVDGRAILEVFVDLLDPTVVLEIDTFWSTVGGADTPALLRRLGDRVQLIHVKDGRLPTPDAGASAQDLFAAAVAAQLPAGSGDVDVTAILDAAPDAIRVIEFDQYAGDVFAGIAASRAWLQQHDRSTP